MRWTATDETGWVADLDSAAATVSPLRDGHRLEGTAGRVEVVLAERRRLREQAGR